MIEINGFKRPGLGAAQNSINKQFALLIKKYSPISNCYKATINVQLDKKLIVLKPDCRTDPIQWDTKFQEEIFDFLEIILFIPRLNKGFRAWLYIPHYSVHRRRKDLHEVLCERIEDLIENENLTLIINKEFVILPYDDNTVYVI
jgi:CTP-dependent riboflavin kinase